MKKVWERVRSHGIEIVLAVVLVFSLCRCYYSEIKSEQKRNDTEQNIIYQIQEKFPEEEVYVILSYLDSGDEELREKSFEAVDRILQWYEEADRCAENLYDFLPK